MRGTDIACNIQTVLTCWLRFSSEWAMTLLTHDKDLLSTYLSLFGGNCDWQFTILIICACDQKYAHWNLFLSIYSFSSWFIVFAKIRVNQNFVHGQAICNAVNLFKLPPLIVSVLFLHFLHWLPQTQVSLPSTSTIALVR